MSAADIFPLRDVADIDASPNHVGQRSAGLGQRGFNVADDLDGLAVVIARGDQFSLRVSGGGSRYLNVRSDAHRARVADLRLPRRAARNVLALHVGILLA